MPTGDPMCPVCGTYLVNHAPGSLCFDKTGGYVYGRYNFTPTPLTEADIRRIMREELQRAKEQP